MGCMLSICNESKHPMPINAHQMLTVPANLLDLTLKQVSVPSSHNSYISGFQHLSFASCSAIQDLLEKGIRCIELDVFGDNDNIPIVAHGIIINPSGNKPRNLLTTTHINFEEALHTIAAFETQDPLFICLELNTRDNLQVHDNMVDLINALFAPRLIRGSVVNLPLRDLMGKVILMSGNGANGALTEMINIKWGTDDTYNWSSSTPLSEIPKVGTMIGRIYPQGDLRGALSLNFDSEPFVKAGVTFVALNGGSAPTDTFYKGFMRTC